MSEEIEFLRRRLERERLARKQAEHIAEEKSRELFLKGADLESALKEERKAREEIETLRSALEAFTAKLDAAEIVQRLHQFLDPAVPSRSTTLYLWADNRFQVIKSEAEAQSFSVTVSIGISECLGAEDSLDTLLARSDEALYKAKNTGRNRVLIWSPP